MKHIRVLILCALVTVFVIGCGKDDVADIQAFLENSPYFGDGALRMSNDSTSTPENSGSLYLFGDTIPFVRWVRCIELPVTTNYDITVTGDSADIIATSYFYGAPPYYGFFVRNEFAGPIYTRTITDSVLRKVKLYRDDTGWHISSLTAAELYTVGAQHPVTITQVEVKVNDSLVFVIDNPATYFTREQLPTFKPNDTVEVIVTCSAQDDSTWAFLHHGAGHKPGYGLRRHHRDPFYKDNTTTFSRTWYIADDSVLTTPAVRHSAIDVVGWQTLFGDSTVTYYARAWGLPYIVKTPADQLPED